MPPALKPFTAGQRLEGGFGSMVAFPPPLSEPVQRARPAGSAKKKRGVVAAPAAVPVCAKPANLVTTKVPTQPTDVVIAKRVNYSRGEPAERMEAAVRDWLGKTGTYLELAEAENVLTSV